MQPTIRAIARLTHTLTLGFQIISWMAHRDVVEDVASWLESCRESAVADIRRGGRMDVVRVQVPIATHITESGATIATDDRDMNPLAVGPGRTWLSPFPPSPGRVLHDAYGAGCWYWTEYQQPNFATDPVGWIENRLLTPTAHRFVRSVPRLSEASRALAMLNAEQLVTFIEGNDVNLETQLPIAGLRVIARLAVGPVRLRPLTSEEIAGRINPILEHDDLDQSLLAVHVRLAAERAMLEVTETVPKRERREPTSLLQRIVLALQIQGSWLWTGSQVIGRETPIGAVVSTAHMPLAGYGTIWSEATEEGLRLAVDLARQIPSDVFRDSSSKHSVAFKRFALGCADPTPSEAVIDFVIALEAVLLPRSNAGELGFRFALNGAYATGAKDGERPQVFEQLREVYNIRSKLVHGATVDLARLPIAAIRARELSAKILRRGLDSGWLDQDDFQRLALS